MEYIKDKKAVRNAPYVLYDGLSNIVAEGFTDSDGIWSTELSPGVYTLHFAQNGHHYATEFRIKVTDVADGKYLQYPDAHAVRRRDAPLETLAEYEFTAESDFRRNLEGIRYVTGSARPGRPLKVVLNLVYPPERHPESLYGEIGSYLIDQMIADIQFFNPRVFRDFLLMEIDPDTGREQVKIHEVTDPAKVPAKNKMGIFYIYGGEADGLAAIHPADFGSGRFGTRDTGGKRRMHNVIKRANLELSGRVGRTGINQDLLNALGLYIDLPGSGMDSVLRNESPLPAVPQIKDEVFGHILSAGDPGAMLVYRAGGEIYDSQLDIPEGVPIDTVVLTGAHLSPLRGRKRTLDSQ